MKKTHHDDITPIRPWNRGPGLRPLFWTYVVGWSVIGLLTWWLTS
jgi:hypothetical protein